MAELKETDLDRNPYVQFERWFADAREAQTPLPEGMTVATCDKNGVVSARVCLLKSFDQHGFVFFTNFSSRKGEQLRDNPHVALCFWWAALERQVRIEGGAVRVTEEESDAYFQTRPRGSQIGAWASEQSRVLIGGRAELESRFAEMETTYRDKVVPRPPHWGGYRVIPNLIEFWQGQPNRLHDRFTYRLRSDANDWVIERLAP